MNDFDKLVSRDAQPVILSAKEKPVPAAYKDFNEVLKKFRELGLKI